MLKNIDVVKKNNSLEITTLDIPEEILNNLISTHAIDVKSYQLKPIGKK